jgi:hypothetical protein
MGARREISGLRGMPWYVRWTTYLTGISGLLAAVLLLTQQGKELTQHYVVPIYRLVIPAPRLHDTEFDDKFEQLLFLDAPNIKGLTQLFGDFLSTFEESRAGAKFDGYVFENNLDILLYGVKVTKADKKPVAVVVAFKNYPDFIRRILLAKGLDLKKITISRLQKVYVGSHYYSEYSDDLEGEAIAIFNPGFSIFDSNAALFFFPKITGCDPSGQPEKRLKLKDPKLDSDYNTGQLHEAPTIEQVECLGAESHGYLLGIASFDKSGFMNLEVGDPKYDDESYAEFGFWFLQQWIEKSVGYTKRKLQLIEPAY